MSLRAETIDEPTAAPADAKTTAPQQPPPLPKSEPNAETSTTQPSGWLRAIYERLTGSSASWLGSAIIHGTLLLLFALFSVKQTFLVPSKDYLKVTAPEGPPALDANQVDEPAADIATTKIEPADTTARLSPDIAIASPWQADAKDDVNSEPDSGSTSTPTGTTDGTQVGTSALPEGKHAFAPGAGFGGRDPYARPRLSAKGGTPQSEAAVERGLAWLAAHQRENGSWNFDHQNDVCRGECRNPGNFPSTTAATGLALLPFLGAGHTHNTGRYRDVVQRGIYYLGSKMIVTDDGGDLREDSMYAQGIATIALCECYAMTKDEALRPYAQSAIDFILYAQDHNGGGWRYMPGQPGDTTVTGWQVMALRCGELAGLRVPTPPIALIEKFLDSVQSDHGAGYGYQSTDPGRTTTSVGLLCRMFLGWPRDTRPLIRGISSIERVGPHPTDMYFNYYATQVMHHFGGSPWIHWNRQMRDYLVQTQATVGHETGSWYFGDDDYGKIGGRLCATSLAIMTLEVYYRYLPIYEKGSK
jgi:hypothetical protein